MGVGPNPSCYILTLPLLFLTLPCPFTPLVMRLLTAGTALLWSLTSLMSSQLILLISFHALPLNQLPFGPLCAIGPILLIALSNSAPDALMETPQSFGLPLEGTLLTLIRWNTRPSVESTFARPISLMVVIDWLSSYLLILSPSPWISYRSLLTCFSCVSAIISSLLFP